MTAWAMVLLALALDTPDINLLKNPSFERLNTNGAAFAWSTFVEPKAGAFADLDPLARTGTWSALVHNPDRYEREPANNWSQVIVEDVSGREIVLSGYVRTEAATEAALWLQCFSQDPVRVVAANTSTSDYEISGTEEWQRIETQVSAPASTDFVVVRCVLKGEGTAWFDDLLLVALADTAPQLDLLEPGESDAAPDTVEAPADRRELSTEELLELSLMLQDAVRELSESNARLLQRVTEIQSDLHEVRMESLEALEPMPPVRHPLVPHVPRTGDSE